ncbi:MAG TPA: response regulator [Pseudolabrys sp.]|nr:response regulator [Pseudolabrys sp.]
MPEQGRVRVLVVASDATHRSLWSKAAKVVAEKVELVDVADGREALPVLHQADVDVMILEDMVSDAPVLAATARAMKPPPLIAVAQTYTHDHPAHADFRLRMPTTIDDARTQIASCLRARQAMRVLVVDDSSTMRSIVRKVLAASRFPMQIVEAEDGHSALAAIDTQKFDVIFLDYNLPGLNGLDTVALIRQKQADSRVVIISSTQDPTIATRAQRAGATDFLKKPFYAADIDRVIERQIVGD